MCKLRPLLEDWLHETDRLITAGASVQDIMEGVAIQRVTMLSSKSASSSLNSNVVSSSTDGFPQMFEQVEAFVLNIKVAKNTNLNSISVSFRNVFSIRLQLSFVFSSFSGNHYLLIFSPRNVFSIILPLFFFCIFPPFPEIIFWYASFRNVFFSLKYLSGKITFRIFFTPLYPSFLPAFV